LIKAFNFVVVDRMNWSIDILYDQYELYDVSAESVDRSAPLGLIMMKKKKKQIRFTMFVLDNILWNREWHEWATWSMILMSLATLFALKFITAPYGRHAASASRAWGPLVPAKLAWIVMESPNIWWIVFGYMFAADEVASSSPANRALLFMFAAHYVNRSFLFPALVMRGGKPMPLSVCLMAFTFCTCNGYLQSRSLLAFEAYESTWLLDWRFLGGTALFVAGFASNVRCDVMLASLRKPGETGYKIPRGFLFDYVSAANYFAEIVEWSGFAVACWSLPAAAFALYTFANLAPRGHQTHRWYQEKFKDDYPKQRRAVIPFLS
jgi:3-oxo-5-alpha-steroid 4-dehydrogenase 1